MKVNFAIVFLAVIILVAAYFRLSEINLAEFKGDEARDAGIARNFVQNGKIPLVGAPLSIGGNSGPVYYFILSFPFLFSPNPAVASAFIAIVNLIAIVLTYMFAKEFFNERVAVIACALAAVSPFIILYSRKIWNPDLLYPFLVILLYSLYSFAYKKKSTYLVTGFISYAIMLQLHAITLFLLPAIVIFLFKFRKNVKPKYFFAGLISFLILFSPFFYFEATNNFQNTKDFVSSLGLFDFSKINTIAIQHIASMTSGTNFDFILGNDATAFYKSIFNVNQFFVLENMLLLIGFIFVFAKTLERTSSENLKYSILFFWVSIPILILFFFTGPQYPHLLLMLFPVQFILIGIVFDFMLKQSGNFAIPAAIKLIALSMLFVVLSSQFVFDQGFLNFLKYNGGTQGFYEIGLQYKIDVAKYIAVNSPGNFTISYSLTPNDIGAEYYYLLSLFGKAPSNSAPVNYIIVNNLQNLNFTESQVISKYSHVSFGPLTVYVVR